MRIFLPIADILYVYTLWRFGNIWRNRPRWSRFWCFWHHNRFRFVHLLIEPKQFSSHIRQEQLIYFVQLEAIKSILWQLFSNTSETNDFFSVTMSPSNIWSIIWCRGKPVPSMSSWNANSRRGSISPRRALRSHSSRRRCCSLSSFMFYAAATATRVGCCFVKKKFSSEFLFGFFFLLLKDSSKFKKGKVFVSKSKQENRCAQYKPHWFVYLQRCGYRSQSQQHNNKKRRKKYQKICLRGSSCGLWYVYLQKRRFAKKLFVMLSLCFV